MVKIRSPLCIRKRVFISPCGSDALFKGYVGISACLSYENCDLDDVLRDRRVSGVRYFILATSISFIRTRNVEFRRVFSSMRDLRMSICSDYAYGVGRHDHTRNRYE